MQDPLHVQDWLRVQRMLLKKEAAFTDLALRAAAGEVSLESLAEERESLEGLRELCTAAYAKAFPGASRKGSGGG